MINKKFKDFKVGSIFFEWSELRQDWDKYQKTKFNEAIRLIPKLDFSIEFDPDAFCSFKEKGD